MRRAAALLALAASVAAQPRFRERLVAGDLKGGYQVVPFDVNRDGRADLIALASGMPELVWFENPGWQRRVLASGMARMINLAACEGIEGIVVAQAFENDPARSAGIVTLLTPGANRSEPWQAREIDRLPASHRLRCAGIDGSGPPVVINAPLADAAARPPEYRGNVPVVYYRPGEWKRTLLSSREQGVLHGIFIAPWESGKRDCVLTASFLGIHAYCADRGGAWRRTEIARGDPSPWPRSGSSDIAPGRLGRRVFLASIEPWHGHQVAIYTRRGRAWERRVIDDTLVDGHTIVTADFDGDGREEVIAGYRGQGRSVYLYRAEDGSGARWKKTVLDAGGIAAAACAAADLNQDGRLDVACIGSATANLKWYENLGR